MDKEHKEPSTRDASIFYGQGCRSLVVKKWWRFRYIKMEWAVTPAVQRTLAFHFSYHAISIALVSSNASD